MRTSSIKSRIAATTLFITLTLAVPAVEAKPAQPRKDTIRSTITVITQLIQRYFGISSNEAPIDPVPVCPIDPAASTTTSTSKGTVLR